MVRQQVLAQPSAELESLTWARLEDGTPLVTASRMGRGELILFHVTADPDWSDLPYTGAFVEMLRRSVVSGGERTRTNVAAEGALAPTRTLDGFGVLGPPPVRDANRGRRFPDDPSQPDDAARPLCPGPGGERALNAGAPAPAAFDAWPLEVQVTEQAQSWNGAASAAG